MSTASPDAERLARIALSRVVEPGDERVGQLVRATSAAEVWEALRADDLHVRGVDGYRMRLADADPHADLERAASCGARAVIPGDDEWPTGLDAFDGKRPLLLWARGDGDLRESSGRAVAVVGSRAATGYGEHVAGEMGVALAERGWTVVSGGAYGIDARAHRGALIPGGPTLAVLACGIDTAYPRGHEGLFDQIAGCGAVVAELPPGATPTRYRFLERNRLIAGLSTGVVVVEAALRSGAANTARWAERLGRSVMAVPGPVTSAMSAGCHTLLRSHTAECVTDAAEVIEIVGRIGADLAPQRRAISEPRDTLDAESGRVLEALPARGTCTPDRLARTAGLDPPRVLRALGRLESGGWVEHDRAGWRLAANTAGDTRNGGA
ncbi:MAG: DNA-processing protein DprA [Streptosporangiales bacterium]